MSQQARLCSEGDQMKKQHSQEVLRNQSEAVSLNSFRSQAQRSMKRRKRIDRLLDRLRDEIGPGSVVQYWDFVEVYLSKKMPECYFHESAKIILKDQAIHWHNQIFKWFLKEAQKFSLEELTQMFQKLNNCLLQCKILTNQEEPPRTPNTTPKLCYPQTLNTMLHIGLDKRAAKNDKATSSTFDLDLLELPRQTPALSRLPSSLTCEYTAANPSAYLQTINYCENQKSLSTLLFHRKSCLSEMKKEIEETDPHLSTNLRNIYHERKKGYQRAQAEYYRLTSFSHLSITHEKKGASQIRAENLMARQTRNELNNGSSQQIMRIPGKEPNFREGLSSQVGPIIDGDKRSQIAFALRIQKEKQEMQTPERRPVQIPRQVEADRVQSQQDDIIRGKIKAALTEHKRFLPLSLNGMVQPILKKQGLKISSDAITQLRELYIKRNYLLAKEYKIREHKAVKAKQNVVSKELLQGAPFSSHSHALEINGFKAASSGRVN